MNDDVTVTTPDDPELADAHDLPPDLPGDALGGGLGNADTGEPASDG
jgi:hypothetical protein